MSQVYDTVRVGFDFVWTHRWLFERSSLLRCCCFEVKLKAHLFTQTFAFLRG